jgi:S1-C subfamily serine protease
MITALCGCSSIINPSARTRQQSFAEIQEWFTVDQMTAAQQAYLILAGDFKVETGAAGVPQLSLTNTGVLDEGMAIGLSPDGYLLTAGHVVTAETKTQVWVAGSFDGRFECRPARVVFRNELKPPADVAVLKVEEKLDHYASFGSRPQPGDRVFAVVCYRDGVQFGGKRGFAGGRVLGVRNGPAGSSVALVDTNVPLRRGDSGGPLLSSTGQLIGVFTVIRYGWPTVIWKRWTTSVFPHEEFIRSVIAADRASAQGPNPKGCIAAEPVVHLSALPN